MRNRKPADVYARELIKRYGARAGQIASNRYDATENMYTAAYYEDVMTEIERAKREAARAKQEAAQPVSTPTIPNVAKMLDRVSKKAVVDAPLAVLSANWTSVDLKIASPHQFCETLAMAAKIGVTDELLDNPRREGSDLMAFLCTQWLPSHENAFAVAYNEARYHTAYVGGKKP